MSGKAHDPSRSDIPTKTLRCETYQQLRDGPKTPDELSRSSSIGQGVLRNLVVRLKAPRTNVNCGSVKTRGNTTAVWYLWGDDRRAVRKFIQVNTDYVASCMTDQSNPLVENWDDALWALICEEWDQRVRSSGGGSV